MFPMRLSATLLYFQVILNFFFLENIRKFRNFKDIYEIKVVYVVSNVSQSSSNISW